MPAIDTRDLLHYPIGVHGSSKLAELAWAHGVDSL